MPKHIVTCDKCGSVSCVVEEIEVQPLRLRRQRGSNRAFKLYCLCCNFTKRFPLSALVDEPQEGSDAYS